MRARLIAVGLAGAFAALAGAGAASGGGAGRVPADQVSAAARGGLLQVGRDGAVRVAYVRGRELLVARRAGGAWVSRSALELPAGRFLVDGFALDAAGRETVLLRGDGVARLLLARRGADGWRLRPLVEDAPNGAVIGPAGLALDKAGQPVVAYTLREITGDWVLRLVRGSVSRDVTAGGFPESDVAPAAAPAVLPDGRVQVIQTYGFRGFVATIAWYAVGRTFRGQFIYAAVRATRVGRLNAVVAPDGTVYSAWSEYTFGEPIAILATYRSGPDATTTLRERSTFAGLGVGEAGPEFVVNRTGSAELVHGGGVIPVDGRVADLALGPRGDRWVLVEREGGLFARRLAG